MLNDHVYLVIRADIQGSSDPWIGSFEVESVEYIFADEMLAKQQVEIEKNWHSTHRAVYPKYYYRKQLINKQIENWHD